MNMYSNELLLPLRIVTALNASLDTYVEVNNVSLPNNVGTVVFNLGTNKQKLLLYHIIKASKKR